jgi:hypothetical protein
MFTLNEVEQKAERKFKREHRKCQLTMNGFITYSFTQTGIGVAVEMKCSACGILKNITDYKSW